MGRIFGQKVPLKMMANALKKKMLHHTLLLQGAPGVGKFELAQNLAKSLYCKQKKLGFCDKCDSCVSIQLFRHPNLHYLCTDDRTQNISFYLQALREQWSERPNFLKYQCAGEVANLLHRHRMPYLEKLKAEKKAYPEGVKLSETQLEKTLRAVENGFETFFGSEEKSLDDSYDEFYIEHIKKCQNSLDRTVITKQGLELFLRKTRIQTGEPRVFVLQNIELIHPSAVGALLKILEEPPEQTYFLLITESAQNLIGHVIAPLKSRSFELNFNALSQVSLKSIFEKKWALKKTWSDSGLRTIIDVQKNLMFGEAGNKQLRFLNELIFRKVSLTEVVKEVKKREIRLSALLEYYRNLVATQISLKEPKLNGVSLIKINKILNDYSGFEARGNYVEKNLIQNLLLNLANCV